MKTKFGLVFKQVTKNVEKVNAVNYLTKPPPPLDEFYYDGDYYAGHEQTGDFSPNTQGSY